MSTKENKKGFSITGLPAKKPRAAASTKKEDPFENKESETFQIVFNGKPVMKIELSIPDDAPVSLGTAELWAEFVSNRLIIEIADKFNKQTIH